MTQIWEKQGLTPVIAHVDRYIGPWRDYGIPSRLETLPVMVQANASFFLKPGTRNMALRLLSRDRIHLLGSDCHNMTDRPPNLGKAIELIRHRLGQEALDRIGLYQSELLQNET
jgi:protein-tyrosine phosphatase